MPENRPNPPPRLSLYWNTLRYLHPEQVFWRLIRPLRRRWPLGLVRRKEPVFNADCLAALRGFLSHARACGLVDNEELEALRNQRFNFLNQPSPPDDGRLPWADTRCSRLWRYQLHGFRMARELALANTGSAHMGDRDRVAHWIEDWMRRCPEGMDVAWDPYPIAERLMHWAMAEAVFSLRSKTMRRSFQRQALRLAMTLEYDLRANHLLREAVALTVAGILLQDPILQAQGVYVTKRETDRQILSDGGHYERSPMYHALLLFDLLLLHAALPETPPWLESALSRMSAFMAATMHPDGDIALFNDAVLGQAPAAKALLALAVAAGVSPPPNPVNCAALINTGVYVLGNDRGARMLVKAGPPGPDDQPGHAHGDPFTFELSLNGLRFLADSGVHGYAGSPLREYDRSVQAHNTLCINGQQPMECWSVFRVARRHTFLGAEWRETDDEAHLTARCRWWQGWRQTRDVYFNRHLCAWLITDTVEGDGPLDVWSLIHVHSAAAAALNETGSLEINRDEASLGVQVIDGGTLLSGGALALQGWYSPRFGETQPMPVFIVRGQGCERICVAYVLAPMDRLAMACDWGVGHRWLMRGAD